MQDDESKTERPAALDSMRLLAGGPDDGGTTAVEGFSLGDGACLLLNYLGQATVAQLQALKRECETRTTTNCWCMAYDLAPSMLKFVEQELSEREPANADFRDPAT